jgi:hypothetical protein
MPPFAIVRWWVADFLMLLSDVVGAGDALGEAGFGLSGWQFCCCQRRPTYSLVYELIAFLNTAIFSPIPIGWFA